MRSVPLIALALGLVFAGPARAEVFEIPEDESVVSIALPDGWPGVATAAEATVNGRSPDGALTVRFTVVDDAKADAFQARVMQGDPARGLVPDPASEQRESLTVAARRTTDLTYRLSGPGGLQLRLLRMELVPGKILFLAMTGTPAAFAAQKDGIASILDEIKPLDN